MSEDVKTEVRPSPRNPTFAGKPCRAPLMGDEHDPVAAGTRILMREDVKTVVAAGAWTGYQRLGRGVFVLPLGSMTEGGKATLAYWSREHFAPVCAEHALGSEWLEVVDHYVPEVEYLVCVIGVDVGRGARTALLCVPGPPAPQEAHAAAQARVRQHSINIHGGSA